MYEPDLLAAASRHYDDGVTLKGLRRYNNAGYHFGLAAECAIKGKLIDLGVRTDDEAIWKHFPELRELALMAIEGRGASEVRRILEKPSFFQGWSIKMRYAKNTAITENISNKWQTNANEALGLLIG